MFLRLRKNFGPVWSGRVGQVGEWIKDHDNHLRKDWEKLYKKCEKAFGFWSVRVGQVGEETKDDDHLRWNILHRLYTLCVYARDYERLNLLEDSAFVLHMARKGQQESFGKVVKGRRRQHGYFRTKKRSRTIMAMSWHQTLRRWKSSRSPSMSSRLRWWWSSRRLRRQRMKKYSRKGLRVVRLRQSKTVVGREVRWQHPR